MMDPRHLPDDESTGLPERDTYESLEAPAVVPPPVVPPSLPNQQQGEGGPGAVTRRQVRIDASGHLQEDIPCRQCGYNLRGLAVDQACPECSLLVERSIQADLLRLAHPDWMHRLHRGIVLILIGILASIGVSIIGGIAMVAITAMAQSQPTAVGGTVVFGPSIFNTTAGVLVYSIITLLAIACSLLTIFGVWLLTTPDPAAMTAAQGPNARVLTRWCVMAGILGTPGQILQQGDAAGGVAGGIGPIFHVVMIVSAIIGMVVVVGYVAGLVYLRRLALRLPAFKLARQCRIVTWGLGFAFGIAALTSLIMMLILPSLMTAGGMAGGPGGGWTTGFEIALIVMGIGGCLGGLGSLVFGIWALVLLFIFRAAFKKALATARQNWGSSSTAPLAAQ